jgi:hypothetical protein
MPILILAILLVWGREGQERLLPQLSKMSVTD